MARLVGVDLPREKRLEIALTYIYGIGRTRAQEILQATGISGDLRVHQLSDTELVPMRDYIEANFKIEVTCAARSRPTSVARSRSVATRASVTARVFLSTASARRPTRVPVRARRRPSPVRRSPVRSSSRSRGPKTSGVMANNAS